MLTKTLTIALSTGFIATSAFALTEVQDVDVSVDLDAIQNTTAAAYWTTLADDLETAIVTRIANQIVEEGANVSVDIDEIALANAFESAAGIKDSVLAGTVNVTSFVDNTDYDNYDLTVTYDHVYKLMPTGTDVDVMTLDSKDYYDGMVSAFAEQVAENLQK